jgi:hypothetical protein
MDKSEATADDVQRGRYEHERSGAGTHLIIFSSSMFREIYDFSGLLMSRDASALGIGVEVLSSSSIRWVSSLVCLFQGRYGRRRRTL